MRRDVSNSDLLGRERPAQASGDFDWNEFDSVVGKATSALRWAEFDEVLSDVTATLKSAKAETGDGAPEEQGSAVGSEETYVPRTSDVRGAASTPSSNSAAPEPFERAASTERESSEPGRGAVADWQAAALEEFYGSTLADGSPSMLRMSLQPAAMAAVALLLAGVFWAGWSMHGTESSSRWQEAKIQVIDESEYVEALDAEDDAKTPAAVKVNVTIDPPIVLRQALILPSSLLGPESVLHAAPLGLAAAEGRTAPTKVDARPDGHRDVSASAGIGAEKMLARSATDTQQR